MEIHHGFENVIKLIEKFKECNMNPYKVVKIVPNGELSYLYVINWLLASILLNKITL